MKVGRIELALFGALLLLLCVVPFSLAQPVAPTEPVSTPILEPESAPAPGISPTSESDCSRWLLKPQQGNWECLYETGRGSDWYHNGSLIIDGDFIMPLSPDDMSSSGNTLNVLGNISISGAIVYNGDVSAVLVSRGCATVGSVRINWSGISVPRGYRSSDGGMYEFDIVRQNTINSTCSAPLPMTSTTFSFTPATKWCRSYSPVFHNTPRWAGYNGLQTSVWVEMYYVSRCANYSTLIFLMVSMVAALVISLIVYFCHTRPQNEKLEFNRM